MLNENEIRLLTAGLVLLLGSLERSSYPDLPEIQQLLAKLNRMRDAQAALHPKSPD